MNKQNLLDFKEKVRDLNKVLTDIREVWDDDIYTTVATLIQNLGFESRENDLQTDTKKCERILKALRSLSNYEQNNHLINWVVEEVEMLYHSLFICGE